MDVSNFLFSLEILIVTYGDLIERFKSIQCMELEEILLLLVLDVP